MRFHESVVVAIRNVLFVENRTVRTVGTVSTRLQGAHRTSDGKIRLGSGPCLRLEALRGKYRLEAYRFAGFSFLAFTCLPTSKFKVVSMNGDLAENVQSIERNIQTGN